MPLSFTYGLPAATAAPTERHGASFVQAFASLPDADAYATFTSVPHVPFGKHAVDVHSLWISHARHAWSAPQTGALSAVHSADVAQPVEPGGASGIVAVQLWSGAFSQ
jgi:hypothetical protein